MFTLTIVSGPDSGSVLVAKEQDVVVGRKPDKNGLSVSDHSISRKHLRIFGTPGDFQVEDMGSGNGTLVNGLPVTIHGLRDGDLITAGLSTFLFHELSDENHEATPPAAVATITMDRLRKSLHECLPPHPSALYNKHSSSDANSPTIALPNEAQAHPDLEAVYRAAQLIRILDSDKLYGQILELIFDCVAPAERATILMYEKESTTPEFWLSRCRTNRFSQQPAFSETMARRALQEGEALLINDVAGDGRFAHQDSIRIQNIRSAMCVPLTTQVDVQAVLYVDSIISEGGFNTGDLRLLSLIGIQVAAALENAHLYEHLAAEKEALAVANRKLSQTQDKLLASERLSAVGRLAAGVVHDLRSPMTVTMGHAEFLLSLIRKSGLAQCEEAQFIEGLEAIVKGTVFANEIVEQLLQFSRRSPPVTYRVELQDLIKDVLKFLHPELNRMRIQIDFETVETPLFILADNTQIRQVLVNLILNALQAMKPGGHLTIRVGQTNLSTAQPMIWFSVTDDGLGLSEAAQRRIFEPFFTTQKGKQNGLGLGLSVTYGVVEAHSGRIAVESKPGKGTTFRVYLPLAENVKKPSLAPLII